MQVIRLAVFDLDGTILDSEWAHEEAKTTIIESLGGNCEIDLNYFIGRSNRVFWRTVLDAMGKQGDVDELTARQFAHVISALKRAKQPESPGLTQLLRYCRDTGRKTAVCSGSDEHFVLEILDYLGVRDLYDYVISAKDAARLKPAPDIFQAALGKAGIPAAHAIVLEDSSSGTIASQAAGIRCIGYTAGGANAQDLSRADYRIERLSDAIKIIKTIEEGAAQA
jgi:HAD superfamily hydrolase (TIGR01509 family)